MALLAAGSSVAQTRRERAPVATPAPPPSPVRTIDQQDAAPVVQPAPPPAQFDAERRAREAQASLNDQMLVYAALLVAVVSFLVIAFAVQAFYLALGMRVIRRSAELAERNAVAGQRAFISIGDLVWNSDGTVVEITPTWVNSGATPTRRLQISTNWKASHSELRPEIDINYAQSPESLFLGPAAKAEWGTVVVPMRDIQAALEERLQIYVWGRAVYEDMFEGTKPHFFEFCHRVEVTGEAPAGIKLRFKQFGRANGSDEDIKLAEETAS